MPIYEYECRDCGHVFDALQKMSDTPLSDCPACGKPELRKLLSAPNFRLKGGGWYETDFKEKNKRNLVDGGDTKNASAKSDTGESKAGSDKAATDKAAPDKAGSDKAGAKSSDSSPKASKLGGSGSSSAKSD